MDKQPQLSVTIIKTTTCGPSIADKAFGVRAFGEPWPILIKGDYSEWSKVEEAFLNLFATTRSFLELAEPVHEDECLVNTDNLNDLDAAYQDVYRILNPELQIDFVPRTPS